MSNIRTHNRGKELRSPESPLKNISSRRYELDDRNAHDIDRGATIASKKTFIQNPGLFFGIDPFQKPHIAKSSVTVYFGQGSLFRHQVTLDSLHLSPMGLMFYQGVNLPYSKSSRTTTSRRYKPDCFLSLSRLSLRLMDLLKESMARTFYQYRLIMV